MRQAFAHDAVVIMESDADPRAPGAAITVALCGGWQHEPPCPLAPHHCHAERDGDEVRLRILFATEANLEGEVRRRIDQALSGGHLRGPDGVLTRWRVRRSDRGNVTAREADHAGRLLRG